MATKKGSSAKAPPAPAKRSTPRVHAPAKAPPSARSKLPASRPEAATVPTPPEAQPPTPPPEPTETATATATVAPPTVGSAPLPTTGTPSGPDGTAGAGPQPEEESELEATEEDEDDEGGEAAPVEAAPKRPKGVAPELPLRVESLLFAASKPVNVHDLVARLGPGTDHVAVQRALRKLQRAYANRHTSLEVRKAGDAWALQVRQEYLEVAHAVSPVEIPSRSLRVLALIAFHQPIRQSVLARMVGEAAYTEVKSLKELGFIHAAPKASTLELTTSSYFAEYFGLETTDRDRIRERLASRLGVSLASIPPPPPDDPSNPPPPPPAPSEGPTPGTAAPLPAE